jgi:hypothetical protein
MEAIKSIGHNLESLDRKCKPGVPSLSAILVIPDKYETIRTTMTYLEKQTVAEQIEIVFVARKSDPLELVAADLSCFHSWKIVTVDKIESIGQVLQPE